MELRRHRPEDLESTFECRLRALEREPASFLTTLDEERARGSARLEQALSEPAGEHVLFGALDGARVVAMVGLRRGERARTRHKSMIWGMYVDAEARGQGVGGKLLDLALRHARERMSAEVVELGVGSTNAAARSLYVSRGFRCWGSEPRAMRVDGRDLAEDHMILELG
jgi:ribosomal protein S18 acetylase RimI-like enzyme